MLTAEGGLAEGARQSAMKLTKLYRNTISCRVQRGRACCNRRQRHMTSRHYVIDAVLANTSSGECLILQKMSETGTEHN